MFSFPPFLSTNYDQGIKALRVPLSHLLFNSLVNRKLQWRPRKRFIIHKKPARESATSPLATSPPTPVNACGDTTEAVLSQSVP